MLRFFMVSKDRTGGRMAKARRAAKTGRGKTSRKTTRRPAHKVAAKRKTARRAAAKPRRPARKTGRKPGRKTRRKAATRPGLGARIEQAVEAVLDTLTEAERLHARTVRKAGFQELE
jgi:hypothetical protein